jgi:hypothetical protein
MTIKTPGTEDDNVTRHDYVVSRTKGIPDAGKHFKSLFPGKLSSVIHTDTFHSIYLKMLDTYSAFYPPDNPQHLPPLTSCPYVFSSSFQKQL